MQELQGGTETAFPLPVLPGFSVVSPFSPDVLRALAPARSWICAGGATAPWVTRGQRHRTAEPEAPHARACQGVKHRPSVFYSCDLVAFHPPHPPPAFSVMVLCTKTLVLGMGKARCPFSLGTRQWRNAWCRLDVMNWRVTPLTSLMASLSQFIFKIYFSPLQRMLFQNLFWAQP